MELQRTYLSQGRAARLGTSLGRRQESLSAITNAASIQSSVEPRNEAIAALALPDFVIEHSWALPSDHVTQAFDPALELYASGLQNGDVVLHRTSDNTEVGHFRRQEAAIPDAQGAVLGLEFSPDGKRLAVRFQRGGVVAWDWVSNRIVFRHALDRPRQPLSRPRFTSDGRYLVCMTSLPSDGVAVFDLESGARVAHLKPFKAYAHAAPRPGTTLLTINTETNAVMVDWQTGATVASFPFPAGIQRMAWSLDGTRLAIAGNTVDVHLWDLRSGQKRILTAHTTEVRHLTFSPDGEWLASAAWDGTSRIWDARTGRMIGSMDGFAEQFGNDGRLAVSRFKGAIEIGAIRASPIYRAPAGPGPAEAATWAMDLSADGRWLATAHYDDAVVLWDLAEKTKPVSMDLPGARLPAFDPQRPELSLTTSRTVVTHALTNAGAAGAGKLTWISPTPVSTPPEFNPQWIAFSGDGQTMALGSFFEGRVFVANRSEPEQRTWLKGLGHLTRLEAQSPGAGLAGGGTLALNKDGRLAACGFGYPHGVKVWDTRTGEVVAELGSDNAVIQFSPGEERLAAGSRSSYRMITTNGWRELWSAPREGALLGPGPCAFSPNGAQIAVAISPQLTAILNAATGKEIVRLEAPRPATIKALRWSPDGRRLVAGTMENFIQVWDLAALGHELAGLGLPPLDSVSTQPNRGVPASVDPVISGRPEITVALLLGLLAGGAVTAVAFLALRRHRRLIQEFAASEDRAGERERELKIERELGRLKSQFVTTVSHEFRTPLGVIMASTENLRDYYDRFSAGQRVEHLHDIFDAARTMAGLMEEVLLLGRVEAGKVAFTPQPLDLQSLCERFIDEVRSATDARCPIQLSLAPAPRSARGDEGLLRHILVNLLGNAVKYSPPGNLVEFRVEPRESFAVFTIRDRGIGIPDEDAPHLFEAFHRGRNVGDTPGTGLGMVIVKRCVELHGGEIDFTSHPGEGTTFTVGLPLFMKLG